jgi:hypothetical protein
MLSAKPVARLVGERSPRGGTVRHFCFVPRFSGSFDPHPKGAPFMRQNTLSALILGSAVAVLLSVVPASAQATRTFISGVGNDADPCSRTAPCRTFAGAIVKTFINGEINCLDPGGYGTVNITKSITIDCKHTLGSDLSSGTTGIIVNIPVSANDPTRSVRLRGILINGTGASGAVGTRTGIDGIRILQATSVFVEDSVITDFSQQGIEVAATAGVSLTLDNVVIRNTNVARVTLATTAGQVVASFNNVRIDGTPLGLSAANRVRANIRNVVLSHNATGILTSGVDNILNVDDMMVSFATTAVQASAGSRSAFPTA